MILHDYEFDSKYATRVAYFSMEFAIHQALKVYSGGLGFLSGSHMRSAYDLRQNVVGVGILWSFGYYDQSRHEDRSLETEFIRKHYYFLEDLGVRATVNIHSQDVHIKAFYLPPNVFSSAPIILLSTDIPENDFLARTITHKLYDANEETRISQEVVLGIGGIKVLEALKQTIDIFHMNEGHALPLVYELYAKYQNMDEVKKRVVFTTHTPEDAGNEQHNIYLLHKFGFFNGLTLETVRTIMKMEHEDNFNLTVGALRSSKITNAVSKMHGEVANRMWKDCEGSSEIIYITNAQNRRFWSDNGMLSALDEHEDYALIGRKKHLKRELFNVVADQTGKMFNPDILTVVWARRFAEYKRPGLLKHDFARFKKLLERTDKPIQVIWAGKPYPFDTNAVNAFNELIYISHGIKNMAVLVGYELELSRILKKGSDIWLNTPRVSREASGTSGMTASMNGSIHFSTEDGWHPEFAKHGINAFTIPPIDHSTPIEVQDSEDNKNMMDILENEIIPMYYDHPEQWTQIVKTAMSDVIPAFDSGRMVHEYYVQMYNH
ncbi:alpha-glucan family phosphorylase [Sulfuricurvum sp. RIFCSPLOWO2_12_FULL_43_24]|uniref:alpha-glucan family phosphorylase n=1 Tax=Sulfuricurvum sp. RIFCSPLOWO2_12_FULL_43_24 TaxID=1802247 RepID=UPI0008B4A7E7|nr:alpha-glucan family phosphorylase [Sulfuricurvum sp. RIFCSPLOWO2_12_FULL_43_24]OHD83848.1 MAG: alpha-glucan family phosphorylase [Sulfuricurvum sp. RIFCSPLOWO2_02_43_6]OHD85352.1 MAG: alpha-glucan family phosphorylase [Sulfuricurvum sp. RIFCSPLOWO2_02_FULL_43_45]OHD88664.1 MAG: alpha-glucan family phosphorylase [Sulfuricurvum sp. RIFCSPLOWO2_12_FULL_43_24]